MKKNATPTGICSDSHSARDSWKSGKERYRSGTAR